MRAFLDSVDPVLGVVRLCRGCGETWPRDPEFFYFTRDGKPLGNCKACWADYKRRKRGAA